MATWTDEKTGGKVKVGHGEDERKACSVEYETMPICEKCKAIIEPDYCWCRNHKNQAHDGHFFIPMGCKCHFIENRDKDVTD